MPPELFLGLLWISDALNRWRITGPTSAFVVLGSLLLLGAYRKAAHWWQLLST